jgi:hypothetical protein
MKMSQKHSAHVFFLQCLALALLSNTSLLITLLYVLYNVHIDGQTRYKPISKKKLYEPHKLHLFPNPVTPDTDKVDPCVRLALRTNFVLWYGFLLSTCTYLCIGREREIGAESGIEKQLYYSLLPIRYGIPAPLMTLLSNFHTGVIGLRLPDNNGMEIKTF